MRPIFFPSVGSAPAPPSPPDKFSYEIRLSLADPLTVHSLDPSIDSSRTKEVVLVFIFHSDVIL